MKDTGGASGSGGTTVTSEPFSSFSSISKDLDGLLRLNQPAFFESGPVIVKFSLAVLGRESDIVTKGEGKGKSLKALL